MCTCFRVKANDGSVVIGRTMEFGIDPKSKLTVFPRNYKYQATGANEKPGLSWQGKYGFVGMNMMGLPIVSDGINEKGLYVGDLYLPGFAEYQKVPIGDEAKSISPPDVAGYILSNCATTDEAKIMIEQVLVWPMYMDQLKSVAPLHFVVHDPSGKSIVIEYIKGQLNIHDNPIGVLTNSPSFDWHLINLNNFVNLSATNVPELKLDGDEIKGLGQGTGMLGLPGDATPPSRFVRATAFTQSAIKPEDAEGAVNTAFHIVNNFDIPKGFARGEAEGQVTYDFTFWLTISDLKNKAYYYRGYENPKFYRVSLEKQNFEEKEIKFLDTSNSDWFQEIS